MKSKLTILTAFLAVLILGAAAYAEITRPIHKTIQGDAVLTTAGIMDLTITDGTAVTGVTAYDVPRDPRQINGNRAIYLDVQFSNTIATVGLVVTYYHKTVAGVYTLIGMSPEITVTASADQRVGAAGNFLVEARWSVGGAAWDGFDGCHYALGANAAEFFDVRITTAVSAGNVDVRAFPFGGNSHRR